MKKLIIIALSAITLGFGSCNTTTPATAQNRVQVTQAPASDISVETANVPGFNMDEFIKLLKTTKDPGAIEAALNVKDNPINNLDLDGNKEIDYVKVVEGANGTLTVVDETSTTASVTLATLTVNPQTQTMNIAGNQAYCGDNYNYSTHYTVGDYLLLSYLLTPHRYYVPVYHYGYYPRGYVRYGSHYGYGYSSPNYRHTYQRQVIRQAPARSTYNNSSLRPGNRTPAAAPAPIAPRSSFSQPAKSQRSFQVRNPEAPVRSGGFGNSNRSSFGSSSSHTGSSSPRSSFGSSPRSSFGGNGGRRR